MLGHAVSGTNDWFCGPMGCVSHCSWAPVGHSCQKIPPENFYSWFASFS